MKRIEYFEEIINDDYYKKFDKIYFKNNISKNSEINLPEKIYEKVHIILPKYDKKNFSNNNFFKKLLENSIQDKNLIDYIFYPNKPKVMRSTNIGSEIDINKIILYPLQPISEHIFYLKNEIALIKDYLITIIIDNSKSCFSEFNERHSFLTIMNLLQIINSINLPSLDLILTSNDKPNILLYNEPSNIIFKNYSILENLFILLSNLVIKSDLLNAIKVAY